MIARKLQAPNTPLSPKHIIALGLHVCASPGAGDSSEFTQLKLFRCFCRKTQFCHAMLLRHIATSTSIATCPCDLYFIRVTSVNLQSINSQMSNLNLTIVRVFILPHLFVSFSRPHCL